MVKGRTRQNEPVDRSDGHANWNATAQCPQGPARRRAVNVKFVADAAISRRNDERLSVDGEPDVANEAFVQNLVNRLAVVRTSLRQSLQRGSLRGREIFH